LSLTYLLAKRTGEFHNHMSESVTVHYPSSSSPYRREHIQTILIGHRSRNPIQVTDVTSI
jgi:hypothetical protein